MIDLEPRASIHHEFTAHLNEISWVVNATLVVVHLKIDGNKISLRSLRGVPTSKHTVGGRTTRRSIDAHDDDDDDCDDRDEEDDEGVYQYLKPVHTYGDGPRIIVQFVCWLCPIHGTWPPRQFMCRTRAISTRIPFSEPAWQKRGRATCTCSKRLLHPCACPTAKVSVLLFFNMGAAAARFAHPRASAC